ncbi:MAG TPA: hypothetical protein VFB45_15690 [Pseudolabrys sp.]|nr:hypothetical protein [Pseudolabrys sp.]
MKTLLMIAAIATTVVAAPTMANAGERIGDGLMGAAAGALVAGPVGAIAGGAVGYTAGPHISRDLGFHRHYRRHHYARHY